MRWGASGQVLGVRRTWLGGEAAGRICRAMVQEGAIYEETCSLICQRCARDHAMGRTNQGHDRPRHCLPVSCLCPTRRPAFLVREAPRRLSCMARPRPMAVVRACLRLRRVLPRSCTVGLPFQEQITIPSCWGSPDAHGTGALSSHPSGTPWAGHCPCRSPRGSRSNTNYPEQLQLDTHLHRP